MTWARGPWASGPWAAQEAQAGTSLDLSQTANIALTGNASVSGDIQIGVSFDLVQTANVALSGVAGVSGDIQSLSGALDLAQTANIALTGVASVSGDIQIGTSFDLSQTANIGLTGAAAVSGDVQIGVGLDLTQTAPVALTSTVAVAGDIQTASFTGLFYAQGDLSFAHGETPKKALRRRFKEATAELPPPAELPKPLKFEIVYARRILATKGPEVTEEQIAAVERAIEHSRERVALAAQARKARRRAQQVRLLLED